MVKVVSAIIIFRFVSKVRNFLTNWKIINFSRRAKLYAANSTTLRVLNTLSHSAGERNPGEILRTEWTELGFLKPSLVLVPMLDCTFPSTTKNECFEAEFEIPYLNWYLHLTRSSSVLPSPGSLGMCNHRVLFACFRCTSCLVKWWLLSVTRKIEAHRDFFSFYASSFNWL